MDELFTENATSSASQIDPKQAYESLVGEGKKYATNELLAVSRIHADQFIEQLKKEAQELRNELSSRLTVEQLMTKLSADKGQTNDDGNRANNAPPPNQENLIQTQQLTEDAVAKLVQAELSKHQNKSREQANTAVVVQKLKESYGDSYVSVMQARLDELGISKEAAVQMAATMPKAYLELVTKQAPTQHIPNQTPPRSNNVTSVIPSQPSFKGWSHFEKLRRTNPNEYFKPSTQNEMMRLSGEHGDAFYQH